MEGIPLLLVNLWKDFRKDSVLLSKTLSRCTARVTASDRTCKKNDIDFSSGRFGEFYMEKNRQINATNQKGTTVSNSCSRKSSKRTRFKMHSLQSFTENTWSHYSFHSLSHV